MSKILLLITSVSPIPLAIGVTVIIIIIFITSEEEVMFTDVTFVLEKKKVILMYSSVNILLH